MLGGELMDFFLPVSKLETLKQLLPPRQDTNISVALEICNQSSASFACETLQKYELFY